MKKERERVKYNSFQNIIFLLKGMKQKHPVLIVLILLQIILSVITPVFSIFIPKIALDLVMNAADVSEILLVLGGVGLIMILSMAFSGMAAEGKNMLVNDMRSFYQIQIFLKSLSCDYRHVESEEGQTKYQRAMDTLFAGDWSGTSRMAVATINILVSTMCFLIYSGIISQLHPAVVIILIGLSLVNLFSTRHAQKYEYCRQDESSIYNKKLNYVIYTGCDARSGKDMRIYATGGWFMELRESLIEQISQLTRRIQNRYFAAGAVNAGILFLRDGIAYAYLISAVASKAITVGEFTLYFGAITAFSGFVNGIITNVNELNGANLQMNSMRAYLDIADEPEPETPVKPEEIKDYSIEFRDVTFAYGKGEKPVLSHLSFQIRAGEKAALVGVNGAGKTTIVKLLCGFYQPDFGEILIGGVNIRNFKKQDLMKIFSAVFQDIYLPPFTVAESISLKERKDTDGSRVEEVLRKAGLWEKISQYETGIDTPMTKEIEDGLVLSGGEQQKFLMARALYKNAPVLILDEPTAALDPIAESKTYEQFHQIAMEKTALYISHRLASTRFCDKILFLRDGAIVEEGTHEALMKKGGAYFEMFTVQSQYYREEGKNHEE